MDSFAFWTVDQFVGFFDSVPDPYSEPFLFGHPWSDEVAKAEPEPHHSPSPWLDIDTSLYFPMEGMAASQADGADGAGEVLTQDKLPTESAVHMPNEAPEEMTVAERDCTSGHNSDEGSILDVPSEAPADTRIESEAIVTPTRTPTGDGKATTQGLALATNCEAPLDPQHEVMCAQQPATSESPPDPPAEKEKAAVAQETVKPRLNDGPGIHAGEVEEGTDPGSPPVMLPDVDKMSRTEAVQAEYACCAAAIIYIFITQHSENGESTQDRDSATGKPSAVVLCNSNSPEDARDAERGEMEDTTNETITVWRTK